MAKKKTVVTFVLDETGSMGPIKDDTIGGFNEYIATLKKSGQAIIMSLLKFDSNSIDKVFVDTPIDKVPDLTPETYRPGAMTPLIDACMKAIEATEKKVAEMKGKPNVVVTIQTDGHENASLAYKATDLAAKIKELTAKGWVFTFLGAGIDAFTQASEIGIPAAMTSSYGRDRSKAAFSAAAANTAGYAMTGDVKGMAFSADQRRGMGDTPSAAAITPDPAANPSAAAKRVSKDKTRRRPQSMVDDISL